MKILDSTLREGEQTKGIKFTKSQKVEIVKMLDDFGVDIIEAGHPFVSKFVFNCVKTVSSMKIKAEILAHARARKEDIDSVVRTGAAWVGIWAGINNLSLKHKLNKNQKDTLRMIAEAIKYAKINKLKVRYTIEDAFRTSEADIIKTIKLAEAAGADTVSLADTVGAAVPEQIYNLISFIKAKYKIKLEIHCHNDLGLALANSLSAYRAGVDVIDVTINGLGERAGLTSLEELCLALKIKYQVKNNWKINKIYKISKKIESFSKVRLDNLRPLVGKNAFIHTADLHIKAVKKEKKCYESFNSSLIGRYN